MVGLVRTKGAKQCTKRLAVIALAVMGGAKEKSAGL